LLLRSARAFNCTPNGIIFYERSKRILHAVEQAVAEVSNDEQILKGTIRIAAPQCFGETIVPETLARVRTAYPQLDLELVLNDRIVDGLDRKLLVRGRCAHLRAFDCTLTAYGHPQQPAHPRHGLVRHS
jgi:DNA-binding transcriptional LysR family regulator